MLTQVHKQVAEDIATHSLWGHPLEVRQTVYDARSTMQKATLSHFALLYIAQI